MVIEIKLVDVNDFVLEVVLSDVTYFLRCGWNSEADRWYLTFENALNEVVVAGVPVVTGFDLLAPYRHLQVPEGLLWVASIEGQVGRECFINNNASLFYDDLSESSEEATNV